MTSELNPSDPATLLRLTCIKHLEGEATLAELQSAVQTFELELTSIQDNSLRDLIVGFEGELELVKFTVSDGDKPTQSRRIAQEILEVIGRE